MVENGPSKKSHSEVYEVGTLLLSSSENRQKENHNHQQFSILGKIQTGAHKRGLKPQIFRENRGEIGSGKSGLFGGLIGAFPGSVGAFSGPIGTHSSTPHGYKGRAEIAPNGFGPSPRLLRPRLDFPDRRKGKEESQGFRSEKDILGAQEMAAIVSVSPVLDNRSRNRRKIATLGTPSA